MDGSRRKWRKLWPWDGRAPRPGPGGGGRPVIRPRRGQEALQVPPAPLAQAAAHPCCGHGLHGYRRRDPVDGGPDNRRLRAHRRHRRLEHRCPDLRRAGAAPVRQPVRPTQDDGLRRPEGPVHPARGTLPPPPGPLHELLQQERGRAGDVQGPERCAAAPGVSVQSLSSPPRTSSASAESSS